MKSLSGFCLCCVIDWMSKATSAINCSRLGGFVADFTVPIDSLASSMGPPGSAMEIKSASIGWHYRRASREFGGLITMNDLDRWQVRVEEPVSTNYKGIDVYKLTTWTQGPASVSMRLERGTGPAAFNRPQNPTPPFPYTATELTYQNPEDGTTLAGTLTMPPGEGPFPAVLLLSGSGAQDRDESLMGHKPFLVLADYLTRRGIVAVTGAARPVEGDALGEDLGGQADQRGQHVRADPPGVLEGLRVVGAGDPDRHVALHRFREDLDLDLVSRAAPGLDLLAAPEAAQQVVSIAECRALVEPRHGQSGLDAVFVGVIDSLELGGEVTYRKQ